MGLDKFVVLGCSKKNVFKKNTNSHGKNSDGTFKEWLFQCQTFNVSMCVCCIYLFMCDMYS